MADNSIWGLLLLRLSPPKNEISGWWLDNGDAMYVDIIETLAEYMGQDGIMSLTGWFGSQSGPPARMPP